MKLDQIGPHLRTLRKSAHLTVKELASATELVESQIGHIEGGRRMPPLPTLQRLAEAVGHRLEVRLVPVGEQFTDVRVESELADYVDTLNGLDGLDRELVLAMIAQTTELSDDAKQMMLGMLQMATRRPKSGRATTQSAEKA